MSPKNSVPVEDWDTEPPTASPLLKVNIVTPLQSPSNSERVTCDVRGNKHTYVATASLYTLPFREPNTRPLSLVTAKRRGWEENREGRGSTRGRNIDTEERLPTGEVCTVPKPDFTHSRAPVGCVVTIINRGDEYEGRYCEAEDVSTCCSVE